MPNSFAPEAWSRASKRDRAKKQVLIKGNVERANMDARSQATISFGTMTFRRPGPKSKIDDFTLALPKSIRRCDLYAALAVALGDSWGMVRSIRIVLHDPLEWEETRKNILVALEPLIIEHPEQITVKIAEETKKRV